MTEIIIFININDKIKRTNLIKRDTNNVSTGEFGDVSHGSADAAADVQHAVTWLDIKATREVVFVTRDRLLERLVLHLVRKMEALAPPPFVEEGGQLVVGVDEGGVGRVAAFEAGLFVVVQIVVCVDPFVHIDVALLFLAGELGKQGLRPSNGVSAEQLIDGVQGDDDR